jgi:hypothetical protein
MVMRCLALHVIGSVADDVVELTIGDAIQDVEAVVDLLVDALIQDELSIA